MNRRTFAKSLGAAGYSGRLTAQTRLDSYGGLRSLKFEPSGFFRAEQRGRWWFVTPEGSGFLSFGLNHTNEEYLAQDYNFEFWKEQFGAESKDDPAFQRGFVRKALADLEAFGMNSLGTHSQKHRFGDLAVPYVQGLFFAPIPYWVKPGENRFPDVFSSAFERRCEQVVSRLVTPRKDDPFLIGYTFTDCPILTDLDADAHGVTLYGGAQPNLPTWPRVLRNLGPETAGKQAFVDLARRRYPAIEDFSRTYGQAFGSFDALLAAKDWSPVAKSPAIDDTADNRAFLLAILDEYYRVAIRAIRSTDPNHLLFGDILNAQTGCPDEVVALVGKRVDVLAYQSYSAYDDHRATLDRWSKLANKPLYHSDTAFSVAYDEMPAPLGPRCADQEARARMFWDSATRSLSRPDVIGWNWCGWVDAWQSWRPEYQHSGLQDPFGRRQSPMPETMKRFGERLYDFGASSQL